MKKKIILIGAILLVGVSIAFYKFGAIKKEQPISIATTKAQYGYIAKSVTATGTIEPLDTVSIGAQVSGVVKEVMVDFNSVVKKGQLLAKVDPSILRSQEQESKANLANAVSNMEYQKSNFDRQSQLYNLGAISKADYQLALNQYNSAKDAVDNTQAQLNVAEKTLSYTNIYSPVDGVVLNRTVSPGQTIASSFNAPTLFVIAKDLTKMQVNAAVDEADIGGVQAGQNVTFTVDAFPNDVFKGKVSEILLHPSVSANVVTYITYVKVDNKEMKLKPGMTANINIYTKEDSNALLISSKALTFKPDSTLLHNFKIIKADRTNNGAIKSDTVVRVAHINMANKSADIQKAFVWVKIGDSLVEKRILTNFSDDTNVAVLKGLSTDDEIITNIVTESPKNKVDNAQHSPFMPQMQQKPRNNSKS